VPVDWWIGLVILGVVVAACVVGQLTGVMEFRTGGKDWRRSAGNVMGPIDGLFAPNRQEAMQELERQSGLPAPAPSPGDPPVDLDAGVARIDLSERRNST